MKIKKIKYHLFILGCQQNYYDAKRIAHLLAKMGYVCADEKSADLIIVLACSVRQSAVDRIYGKLRQWKKPGGEKTVIITACTLPADRKKLENKVDAIIETDKIEKELPKILNNDVILNRRMAVKNPVLSSARDASAASLPQHKDRGHAFISIMSGCNNFCSYCAVPYTRGREKSRPMEEIICEAKTLVKNRVREITLLGQNVNSYQNNSKNQKYDNKNKNDFVELLEQLEVINELEKVSFLTSHPKDISRSLIEWMGKSNNFSGELHLPLQSGDDEILRKMNRRYMATDYIKLVGLIRKATPEIKLSTDIIVGFPGETKKQFENTVNLCKKIGFNKAYVSQYSPRPGTTATKLKDDIPKHEKKRRWKILDDLIN